jgi:adenosylcobyric acid synthase
MQGYEIHLGVTAGAALARPLVQLDDGRSDGAISTDDQVAGSYCHGLFDHPQALAALLAWAGLRGAEHVDFAARRAADLERLADAVEQALDWPALAPHFAPAATIASKAPDSLSLS